jgi:flagellar hook protein FlgE
MMRSLFSGVSGLKSHQTRMDVIGNNIANVNTVGFKSNRVTFADTLYQSSASASRPTTARGGTDAKQTGLGASVATIDTIFTDASAQGTGKNTDIALTGNGLFVVKDGSGTYYTRDGAFEYDAMGNLVLPGSGHFVQGWMATNGNLNTSAAVTNITIPSGKSMAAEETTRATYFNNLNASVPTIQSIAYTNAAGVTTNTNAVGTAVPIDGVNNVSATITLSDQSTVTVTSGNYTVGNSIPVSTTFTAYDSLGAAHTIPLTLEKSASNQWTASLANSTGNVLTITEDDGTVMTATLTTTAPSVAFTTTGAYDNNNSQGASIALTYAPSAATPASGLPKAGSITIDFSNLTQYSGSSTVKAENDGNAAGTLKSLAFDSSGCITGTYTNGVIQYEAQVAVAQFNNAAALTKAGGNLYTESNNSGTANIKTATDLGCTITPSSLEMSNVDIANEFSDMIITQRGFQSNSKMITVGDEMLETLIGMKR